MSKQRISSQAGFTLIEVGMGALILVVGFIGLIQAVTIGSQMLNVAQKERVAMEIMDAEIEELRAGLASDISSLTNSQVYTVTVNAAGTSVSGDATKFALTSNTSLMAQAKSFTCSFVKTNTRTNFRRVIYTVTWTGNTGRSYSRTAEMYFGLNGLQLSYQKS